MHLIQILLPTYDNEGHKFSQDIYGRIGNELVARFSGLTAYTRSPAEGSWTRGNETARDEIATMHRDYVAPFLTGVTAQCLKAVTCLYTQTPDAGFVISPHPDSERVIIASACSGHGFKHSAAIGEALAEIVTEGRSHFDLSAFSLQRFLH